MSKCPDCDGYAPMTLMQQGDGRCSRCDGSGKVVEGIIGTAAHAITGDEDDCPDCSGTGQCQTCGGTGRADDSEEEADDDE